MDEQKLREDLAIFYNAMHKMGWDDLIFTPTSVGIPGTEHFLIHEYGLMFNEVTPDNLVKIDITGQIIGNGGPIANSSWMLHRAIHEVRTETNWVVHWHSPDVCALANDPRGVLPISQHALVIRAEGVVNHPYGGPVVMGQDYLDLQNLIKGDVKFILMAGHGATVLADNVEEAFWNMYNLQTAAEIQVKSGALPTLIEKSVEDTFVSKYKVFKNNIPNNGLWNAIKRSLSS